MRQHWICALLLRPDYVELTQKLKENQTRSCVLVAQMCTHPLLHVVLVYFSLHSPPQVI